jgi:hypothetical protein
MIIMALNDKTIYPILTAFLCDLTFFLVHWIVITPCYRTWEGCQPNQGLWRVKTQSKEPQRVSNVRFCHKKLKISFFSIWNHGNHGTLFLFYTHECQETQIKNSVYPILGFVLVNDFWSKKYLSLKNDIFTKDSYKISKLKVKNMRWQ